VAFRADAAFARPEIYEALETRGVGYAIRIPANKNLELAIEDILFRSPGRPSRKPLSATRVFTIRRTAGPRLYGSWRKSVANQTFVNWLVDSDDDFNSLGTLSTAHLVLSPRAIFVCAGLLTGK
jgi:hypothetical protein